MADLDDFFAKKDRKKSKTTKKFTTTDDLAKKLEETSKKTEKLKKEKMTASSVPTNNLAQDIVADETAAPAFNDEDEWKEFTDDAKKVKSGEAKPKPDGKTSKRRRARKPKKALKGAKDAPKQIKLLQKKKAVKAITKKTPKKAPKKKKEKKPKAPGQRKVVKKAVAIKCVQVFGRKKTATAVAYCKRGKGNLRVNGRPLDMIEPKVLQYKLQEPILLLGKEKFSNVDMRVRVNGGGHVSQIYAIRQAISKALVAYYQKFVDEASKKEIKDVLIQYDRTLMVADPRRCEPKKFGGPGARARYQKSYR